MTEPIAQRPGVKLPKDAPEVSPADIALPPSALSYAQDEEWCVVRLDDEWRKVRFHDYSEIFSVPGLYETIFYDVLKCTSPRVIRTMLQKSIDAAGVDPKTLRALDLGAGNGMVGEELATIGVEEIVGVDIIDAAAEAARRDRAGVYEQYLVEDITELPAEERRGLEERSLNCMTCVAALGFGDIPPEAFATAFNLIEEDGWVAFNIKSEFLEDGSERSGFATLVRGMLDDGNIDVVARDRYRHRLSTTGEPLFYEAFVARKRRDVVSGPREV